MKNIEDQLFRTVKLNKQVGSDFLISSKYKDHREWWVLGHVTQLLKRNKWQFPKFALKTNPPDPDFQTFDDHHKKFKPIEILEVLAPKRIRGKEYIRNEFDKSFISDPWSIFLENLRKKFLKRYEADCWLVVYHNVAVTRYSSSGFWHNIILANAEMWYRDENNRSFNLAKSPYEKIIVIQSDGKAAVSIYPTLEIIEPERTPHGLTISLY